MTRSSVAMNQSVEKTESSEVNAVEGRADLRLVDRVRKGDLEAFKELVERYQSRAFAVARGVVGSNVDAEDIVQESFLKAYKNLDSFRGNSSFYTWLYRIVTNLAIDYSRKKYRKAEVPVGEMTNNEAHSNLMLESRLPSATSESVYGNPERSVERSEIREELKQAMNRLSPEHRMVILLREVEGLSYSEIGDVVGCSKGTVMSRLHHARKKLKATLSTVFRNLLK